MSDCVLLPEKIFRLNYRRSSYCIKIWSKNTRHNFLRNHRCRSCNGIEVLGIDREGCGFATFVPLKSRGGSQLPGVICVLQVKGSRGLLPSPSHLSLEKVSLRSRAERIIALDVTKPAISIGKNESSRISIGRR